MVETAAGKSRRRNIVDSISANRGAVLATAGLVAAIAALMLLPDVLVNAAGGRALKGGDRVGALTEERRTVLAGLAAIGAALTLWYTHQRQQLDRDSNRTDRYTQAVEQLGDDTKPAVQLGGIYSLERIALDSDRDRAVALDVISAFVRQRASAAEAMRGAQSTQRVITPLDEPSRAALVVLARNRPDARMDLQGIRWALRRLRNLDLAGADLKGADLEDADLTEADLTEADLTEATLDDAHLADAVLSRANLTRARLADANLTAADLAGANLTRARLSNARLMGANLAGADLTEAFLIGADLTRANLAGANLTRARLSDARLSRTNLSDADLTLADLTGANLKGAEFTGADLTDVHGVEP
jgi:uncharacterized protein YjbI with pentapeptide repeats